MQRYKNILWCALIALLATVGFFTLWKTRPPVNVAPTPSPKSELANIAESSENVLNAPEGAIATLLFESSQGGTASQQVAVGENVAVITIPFRYEVEGNKRTVTEIGDGTAENSSGWYYVEKAVTISTEKIVFSNEGTKAIVPVTYQASIGVGLEAYDDIVVIDLGDTEDIEDTEDTGAVSP